MALLVPVLNGICCNVASIYASRLSTQLYKIKGIIESNFRDVPITESQETVQTSRIHTETSKSDQCLKNSNTFESGQGNELGIAVPLVFVNTQEGLAKRSSHSLKTLLLLSVICMFFAFNISIKVAGYFYFASGHSLWLALKSILIFASYIRY